MKLTIEIPEEKSAFFLELLRSLSFVKLDHVELEKSRIMESIKEGILEAHRAERGEIIGQNAKEWLDEL